MKPFKSNGVTPEILIGTKWVSVGAANDNKNTIEFIDEAYCIYTFSGKVRLQTYKICGDKIIIDSISDSISYTIKDNSFFHNDTLLYIKEKNKGY